MDYDRDLETTNLQALIGLWQQEERRLRSLITNQVTSPEVRSHAEERLGVVLNEIQLIEQQCLSGSQGAPVSR
jgi:hypothetical protein